MGYQFIDSRNGYEIYRKIENGKGKWVAERNGVRFPITYDQARGYAPIDRNEALQMQLGNMFLNRKICMDARRHRVD